GVGLDGLLGPRHDLRHAAAARSRCPQAGLDQFHALHAVGADDFDGLLVEQEGDALFLAVLVVAPRAGHVVLVAPIGAGDAARALADRGPVAVHARVA